MKDFFDLFTICTQFQFDGELLRSAIKATFDRRKTDVPISRPLALTIEFSEDEQKAAQWKAFLRKNGLDGNNLRLSDVTVRLAEFLIPPAMAASQGKQFSMLWTPKVGWTGEV
jgi:hypothetical protein